MWAKEGQEGRRFSRRDSNCCEPLWTTSPHGDLVALIISISGVDVSPHPHPPQETIKQISELHVQMTQKPLSTGAEEANTHFPTEPFTGLRASQCCLPCPTAPRGCAHSASLRTAPEPQAQESQSARCGWGPCSCARQDGWPSSGGREESPETSGLWEVALAGRQYGRTFL